MQILNTKQDKRGARNMGFTLKYLPVNLIFVDKGTIHRGT